MGVASRQGELITAPRAPLGFPSLFALGLNGIIGVGIFFVPRTVAAAVPGPRGALVYLGVAALLAPVGLVFARLGRAFAEDGGPYLYARAAFGPGAAFAVGWTAYVSALFSTSTVLVGLVDATAGVFGLRTAGERLAASLLLLTALMAALSRGLRISAIAWTSVTVLKSIPLLLLPIAAFWARGAAPAAETGGSTGGPLLAAALPVVFALQGFEVVPLPAAQVRAPARNVPLAVLTSLAFAAALYAALHASCAWALPDLAQHDLALVSAARVYGGDALAAVMNAATSVSAFGIAVGMVAMTPRYLAPLGRADALGFDLDRQSARAVPLRAFAVTYALLTVILSATAVWGTIGDLFTLSSLSVTLQYAVTAASLFVLSSRGVAGLSPRDRWPAPLALAACVLLASGASRMEIPIVGGMLTLGLGLRAVRLRCRSAPPDRPSFRGRRRESSSRPLRLFAKMRGPRERGVSRGRLPFER